MSLLPSNRWSSQYYQQELSSVRCWVLLLLIFWVVGVPWYVIALSLYSASFYRQLRFAFRFFPPDDFLQVSDKGPWNREIGLPNLGLGVGLLSATIPLYQSETAPKWIRGSIVGFYQFSITLGVFLSSIVANGTKNRNDTGSYRIPVAVQFAFGLILIIGMLFLPETPRFLIRKGRYDAAAQSLAKLRRLSLDHPALIEELEDIRAHHEHEMAIGSASYISCFRKPLRKRLFTGIMLQAFQQLTGVRSQPV